ncbi:MAG: NTP transferase domain-containing protein [Nitrospira sp.]|nr:NTP transferase domain-containing protein [Nitrospira sp.]
MFPVAILAGGLATRVRSISGQIPKVLLQIADRPFIFHQLELLKRQGIARVVLCVGHLGEQVEAAVGDGKDFGLSVEYSFDGDVLLGTGGAINRALPRLGENFFVLYGDSYLRCSFSEVQSAYEVGHSPALMTVLHNANRWDRSNALYRDGMVCEYDKRSPRPEMSHIDYGLAVLFTGVFDSYRDNAIFDLADIYRELSLKGQLAGFEVEERFLEIGSPQGIQDTEYILSAKKRET